MTLSLWIVVGIVAWTIVGLFVALIWGAAIDRSKRVRFSPPSPFAEVMQERREAEARARAAANRARVRREKNLGKRAA